MPQDALPLFPLGVVLFPGATLPLHIFEERYKEMIGDCLRDNLEFGVVFASDKGMANIGCTATIDKVLKKYPDGRMDILTRGLRRFEIILLDEQRNYLRASIAPFSDEEEAEPPSDLLRQRALSAWVNLMMLEHGGLPQDMPSSNRPDLSFLIADAIPDTTLRQRILALRSERERLELLTQFLPTFIEREKQIRHVRRVAPLNGHSRHTPDLADA